MDTRPRILVSLACAALLAGACATPLRGVVDEPGPPIPAGPAFSDAFHCAAYGRMDDAVVIRNAEMISAHEHAVPVAIEYEVMTDSTNIRLGYGASQIIFNWEIVPNELRVDGPPAGTRNVHGAGWVPTNRFVTIRQVVTEDSMSLLVDGVERATWHADLRGYRGRIRVFTAHGATLAVRSIRATPVSGPADT